MKLRSLINIGLVCLSILSTTACSGENDDSSKKIMRKNMKIQILVM